MKAIIALSVIVLIGVVMYSSSRVEVQNEVEVVTETVEVDVLEQAILQAQEEHKADIEAVAQKAYQAAFDKEMKEVELQVISEFNTKLDERQTQLEKETQVYWRDRENVKNLILSVFPDAPIMVQVCKGESGLRHWKNDGSVVRGIVDPDDTGLCQINKRYWKKEAEKLGLDFENSIEDNVKMARHIYDTQGITAWVYYNNHLSYR